MRAFLLAVFLAGCTSASKPASDAGARIQIFYNNDNFAYLETCGCRVSPIGGMDRRWNAIQAYPARSRIFLDAGNALFKGVNASEYLAPQWFEQASGVVEAYNLLGADAVEVGETEFALGVEKFEELAAKAKFPFLSANIYRGGKRYLKPSVLLTREGKKIGVFGLFGNGLQLPKELEARDAVDAARDQVASLRAAGADMVVALTHEGYEADQKLARAVPGIDLIVGGHSQSLLQHPYEEGKTLLVQLSNEGQMIGMVEYAAADLPKTRTSFVVAELNGEYNEAPRGLANPMKNLVAVTNLRIQETNRALDEKIWAEQNRFAPSSGFETFLSCRDCHSRQSEFHEGKPHSAAFLTLLAKHQEHNLDCVKCHSVGLGMAGGFESLADAFRDSAGKPVPLERVMRAAGEGFPAGGVSYRSAGAKRIATDVTRWRLALGKVGVTKAFPGVQCENCHGAMPGHPFNAIHPGAVRISTCVQCHTQAQAPEWYGKNGELLAGVARAKLRSMKCPR